MATVIPKEVKKELVDTWLLETWKACLLTNAFTYVSGTHILYTDLTNEVPNGSGYATGGNTVTRCAWSAGATGYVDTTNAAIDAVDTAWPASTFANVRYAVVYENTGKKIRAIYDFGSDQSVTNGTFTIQWNAAGLIKIL